MVRPFVNNPLFSWQRFKPLKPLYRWAVSLGVSACIWGLAPLQTSLAAPLKLEEAQELAQALRHKLSALGAFEAHYSALSPDQQTAEIQLIYNPRRQYMLAQIDISEDSRKWLVMDYAQLHGPAQQFDMWLVTSEWKQHFEMSLSKLRKALDNPLGAALALAQSLPQGPDDAQLSRALQPGAAFLSLGLNASDLNLVMGISTQAGGLETSWLKDALFRQALDYQQTDKDVILHFSDARSISIDTGSGLLKRDSWPDPERPGPREIQLKRFGALSQDRPYRELLPELQTLPDGDLPVATFEQILYPVFLTELAYTLQDSAALKTLQGDPAALRARLLPALRQQMQRMGPVRVAPADSEAYFQRLWSSYSRDREQPALSFPQFVEQMRTAASKARGDYSQILIPPRFREDLARMQHETRQALSQMPDAARQSMGLMLEVGMPALWEAMLLERLDAYLDAALLRAQEDR